MIDAYIRPIMDPPLTKIGSTLARLNISANWVTGIGFLLGLTAILSIIVQAYTLAGCLFITNRICDGLDGGIARSTHMTDLGGYLDIISDFIIYPGIPLAFCFADPSHAIYGAFVIFAMSGAMTSFLAFAIICAKNNIDTEKRGKKSFYFLGGICEGFETAVFLTAMCFFPGAFATLALIFGVLCLCTTFGRIRQATHMFSSS